MRTAIIACEMSKAELKRVIVQNNVNYPVFWVKPALHNSPNSLHDYLQALMDEHAGEYDQYLLAMGQCGNATENLKTKNYTVIIPKVDDCITTLLGSLEQRTAISREKSTYFLTESWLTTEQGNLVSQYEKTLEKYGQRRGKMLYREILKHYKRIGLLDTGCYDLELLRNQISGFAEEFNLSVEILPATDAYLHDLLLGPWTDNRFSITPPNTIVHISLFNG